MSPILPRYGIIIMVTCVLCSDGQISSFQPKKLLPDKHPIIQRSDAVQSFQHYTVHTTLSVPAAHHNNTAAQMSRSVKEGQTR